MDDEPITSRLRDATEDDVEAAIESSFIADALQGIAPDVLLEFYLRMVDQMIGREEE